MNFSLQFFMTRQNTASVNFRWLQRLMILAFILTASEIWFFMFVDGVQQHQQQQRQKANITQTTATLSEARSELAATSSGELVFFGGGWNASGYASDRVDIYNVTSGNWTTATLSIARGQLAATSLGNLVFFGGGADSPSIVTNAYDRVDIYNTQNGTWTTATLSQSRYLHAATSVGGVVLFGGGLYILNNVTYISNTVDMYIVAIDTWIQATLSDSRFFLKATSVDSLALFAGGWDGYKYSNIVDIYDSVNNVWFTATLSQARTYFAAASLNDLAFFGGGDQNAITMYSIVDVFNAKTREWNTSSLIEARTWLAASSAGEIVAFGGGNIGNSVATSIVDLYNVTSDSWSLATLSQSRYYLAATSCGNKIFFGGGAYDSNNNNAVSNVVDIFEIPPAFYPLLQPSTPQLMSSNSSTASQINLTVVIVIVIGVVMILIGVGIILFLFIFIKRKKRRQKNIISQSKSLKLQEISMNTTSTISSDSTLHPSTKTYRQNEVPKSSEIVVSNLNSTHYSRISLNELIVEKEIGEGSFGKVYLGKWHNAVVALKFCISGKIEEFIQEINLMISLPPHPNVVQVYGVSIDGIQPVIVMEYCAGGSLDKLLFDSNVKLNEEEMFHLVRGIVSGMLHLHKHNVVHRDLAARNILLSLNKEPKISDFGMSRILVKTNEGKTQTTMGPIGWMAPESLAQRIYSKKSDIWSFGIVVWEIVAQQEPHKDADLVNLALAIRDQYLTPTIPKHCPQKLRQVMEMCWQRDPNQRPTFEAIYSILNDVLAIA